MDYNWVVVEGEVRLKRGSETVSHSPFSCKNDGSLDLGGELSSQGKFDRWKAKKKGPRHSGMNAFTDTDCCPVTSSHDLPSRRQ